MQRRYIRGWISKNAFVLSLVIIGLILLGWPLIRYGTGSFYLNQDPDVVYVTNAILYTKANIISYMDHPGTPVIIFISSLFVPLRLIAKYLLHQNFIDWSFNNYVLLTFYLRFIWLVISGVTLFIFLKVVESLSRSRLFIVFAFLLVMSTGIFRWSLNIAPEGILLLLTSFWIMLLAEFLKHREYKYSLIMVFISGIALAVKFTGAFLAFPAILLPLFVSRGKLWLRLLMLEANIAIYFQSFVVGIWPIADRWLVIVNWFNDLLKHSGFHGAGVSAVFDKVSYSSSINLLMYQYPLIFIFILVTALLIMGFIITKRVKDVDWVIVLLFIISQTGYFVFSRYPTIHYNFVNIFLGVYCFVYFISRVKLRLIYITLPILAVVLGSTLNMYYRGIDDKIKSSSTEQINETLSSWTSFWSSDVYRDQLNAAARKP